MSATASQVLTRARSQIGYREAPVNRTKYGEWYGLNGQAWCAMFLSWVFYTAGLPLPASTRKGFAYTPAGADWFRKQGRWGSTPRVGAVVFFWNRSLGRIAHVGIVESVNRDGTITTIEGNTNTSGSREGIGVFRMKRSTKTVAQGGIVAGYGYPRYTAPPKPAAPAPPAATLPAWPLARGHSFARGVKGRPSFHNGTASAKDKEAVKRIQRRLKVSPVSGWYGPLTAGAVGRFQARNKIPVTGRVDARTGRALKLWR